MILYITLIAVFLLVFFQDVKYRMVYWFLYPLIGILSFCIYFKNSSLISLIINSVMNLLIIAILTGISYFYATYIMQRKFINESMGIGDILLFIFLCFGFATISFILLLVFSLFFSIIMHKLFKNNKPDATVPLAGYMSLFFASIYAGSLLMKSNYLFSY